MLKIGFAEKYFTLWSVVSNPLYYTNSNGDSVQSGVNTIYTYKQNLSIDKETALKKASDMGVTDLTVDDTLRGVRRSFSKYTSTKVEEIIEPTKFQFGKYTNKLISESDDLSYLEWYYGEQPTFSLDDINCPQHNIIIASRLIELNNDYVIHDGELMTEEQVDIIVNIEKNHKELKEYGYHIGNVTRNVDMYGSLNVDGIDFYFPNITTQYYNGYMYYLPVINGNAKRIKNKRVKIYSEKVVPLPGWGGEYSLVSNFEIIN